MFKKSNRSDRRILSFPAVHPCEGISPATLLSSLIEISHNVCNFQSKLFTTQRRHARETIRQVGLLLIFFDEIRERCMVLSDSMILCFSELHLAFQKLQFLLEDCTREGARIWMLMKCQLITSQFRVLIRAFATALDVFPYDMIDVGGEVKELVDLVAKQARKVNIETDPFEEMSAKRVLSILKQFEMGIEPDLSAAKRVLDYLEIRRWSECNKEVKFLEGELCLKLSDNDDREVQFLNSLMRFMSYCRVVIFDELDHRKEEQSDPRFSYETINCLNLEDFRCPISLELMTDPVTVSTGQTYDRSSIQKWLKAGNLICPKTREKLTNTDLVSNTTLKKLINQFCADNGISINKSRRQSRDITSTILPGSLASAEAMKFLSIFLTRKLVFGTNAEKNKAAYEIRLLAKSNIFNRNCLIDSGTVLPLLNLLSSVDKITQVNAIAALLKLSKHASGKTVIMETGGLTSILTVLKQGLCLEARQIAAATIFYLVSEKEYRKSIGEEPGTIPALVELIKEGTTYGKKNSVVAIFGLLLWPKNHGRVILAGTVPLLIEILACSERSELVTDTLAVLAALADNLEGAHAILHNSSALTLITGVFQNLSSGAGKEYCVSILLSLCKNGGEEIVEVLAKDPALIAQLYSLITDGTSHATKKARSLIEILHKFQETSSSVVPTSAASHEQFVHVW